MHRVLLGSFWLALVFLALSSCNSGKGVTDPAVQHATLRVVNLIPNATQYLDRRNNIDIRAAKILRFGRTRTQIGIDVYNVTNSDTITAVNATYSPTSTTWQTPSTVATARYVKFNFQIDF